MNAVAYAWFYWNRKRQYVASVAHSTLQFSKHFGKNTHTTHRTKSKFISCVRRETSEKNIKLPHQFYGRYIRAKKQYFLSEYVWNWSFAQDSKTSFFCMDTCWEICGILLRKHCIQLRNVLFLLLFWFYFQQIMEKMFRYENQIVGNDERILVLSRCYQAAQKTYTL